MSSKLFVSTLMDTELLCQFFEKVSPCIILDVTVSASTWARGWQGFVVVGELEVFLNCELHVLVRVLFSMKSERALE